MDPGFVKVLGLSGVEGVAKTRAVSRRTSRIKFEVKGMSETLERDVTKWTWSQRSSHFTLIFILGGGSQNTPCVLHTRVLRTVYHPTVTLTTDRS